MPSAGLQKCLDCVHAIRVSALDFGINGQLDAGDVAQERGALIPRWRLEVRRTFGRLGKISSVGL